MDYKKLAKKLLENENQEKEKFNFNDLQKQAINFILLNPNPNDKTVEDYAEKNNIDYEKLEEGLFSLATLFVQFMFKEGFSNEKGFDKSSIDKEQLAMGIKVEYEHTNNWLVAMKIALDHLEENPKYYTYLKEMEDKAIKDGVQTKK